MKLRIDILVAFVAGIGAGYGIATLIAHKKTSKTEPQTPVEETTDDLDAHKAELEQRIVEAVEEAKSKPWMASHAPEVAPVVKEDGYTDYSRAKDEMKKKDWPDPYQLTNNQYATSDYPTISLMVYADGVVCEDGYPEALEDYEIERQIGAGDPLRFFKATDGAAYVRNERLKVDYELLQSLKTYRQACDDDEYRAYREKQRKDRELAQALGKEDEYD